MNPQLDAAKTKALEINDSINKLATEQGKATQSFDSAGQRTMSTDIPVAAVDNSAPAVNIPQPNITVPPASSVISSGVPILDADRAEKEAAVATAQTPVTEGESRIRELMGLVGNKSAVNAQLRQEKGVTEASALVSSLVNNLRTQQANLADNDDIFEDSVQMSRLQASGQDITKRTFGAMETEMRLNRAIDRRSQMAGIRATQASYYVATDNLEAAKAEVQEALDLIYDPIEQELQMESFFLQRNDARLSDARRELAGAKDREINFKLNEIQSARDAVDNVIENGYARPDEVQELVAMGNDPQAQKSMAQIIANRGAAQERGLRLEQLSASIATSRAQLAKLSQPDANASLIQSLFGRSEPSISFQEFLSEKGMSNMTLMPDKLQQLEAEYNESFAVDPAQQQQVLSYLVATGGVSVQMAEFMQKNLDMMTPDQKAKQSTTVLRGQTVLRDVERALVEVNKAGKVSGYVAESQRVFGTGPSLAARYSPAFELQQHLESIKSNISIDQLQAMREASPTGGALGQVPVQQQVFLMQVLGSLSPSLQPNVLKENLNDVYNIYLDVMFGSTDELSAQVKSGKMTATQANSYLQQRKETGFNDYNLPLNKSNGQDIGDLVIAPNGDLVRVR